MASRSGRYRCSLRAHHFDDDEEASSVVIVDEELYIVSRVPEEGNGEGDVLLWVGLANERNCQKYQKVHQHHNEEGTI